MPLLPPAAKECAQNSKTNRLSMKELQFKLAFAKGKVRML